MTEYRTGSNWGVTIVREGAGPADAQGRREGDALVAVVVNGDRDLAERICALLNFEPELIKAAHDQCGCLGGLLSEWAE